MATKAPSVEDQSTVVLLLVVFCILDHRYKTRSVSYLCLDRFAFLSQGFNSL